MSKNTPLSNRVTVILIQILKLATIVISGQFGVARDERTEYIAASNGTTLRLTYYWKDGKWHQPSFRLKLINTSHQILYCSLIDLTQTFAIQSGLLPGGSIVLKPGEEASANNGQLMYAEVPRNVWQRGVSELQDVLKLIVSTAEFDVRLLEQGNLELPTLRSTTRGAGPLTGRSALNRVMDRLQVRGISSRPADEELYSDWATQAITFTTIRPQESMPVGELGATKTLGHGVRLWGHPQLKARARLTTVPLASREIGSLTLPSLLRDDPTVVQPFEFSTSRNGGPGLSALELFEVENYRAVQPEQPLVVEIDVRLAEGETILPVGYDGNIWLPLGYVRRNKSEVEIVLQRLPEPHNTRSLTGSLHILFQKIISPALALDFPYPLLAIPEVSTDGRVQYSTTNIATRIAASDRILLYYSWHYRGYTRYGSKFT